MAVSDKIKLQSLALRVTHFRVTWKDLTYIVSERSIRQTKDKVILKRLNGFFDSGNVTAIMGPSGGGKSSLLGCICKQKTTGVTGSINISTKVKVKFAFIQQDNHILERLTVRESMMYSSRLKNEPKADHKSIVDEVIQKLLIEKCADNRPSQCSGGQLKRVIIGLELVSKPNILILDEPTSGLDSVTTWQLINLLIALTKQTEPVAVVLTIHQPSAKLFSLLDSIYLLSCDGQCIFQGSPQRMHVLFKECGMPCPPLTNLSDFALEVAAKEHSTNKLMTLVTIARIEATTMKKSDYEIQVIREFRTFRDITLLTERSIMTMVRDPLMVPLRVACYIWCGLLISVLFGFDSGKFSGCANEMFAITQDAELITKMKATYADLFENVALLSVINLIGWFSSIFPVLLIFPNELDVFLKEYGNGYYSVFSYFMSKVLSDLPFSVILPNLCSIYTYWITGQYMQELWRVFNFAFIFILISLNSSAVGFLIGSSMSQHRAGIAFVGVLSLVPMILLSGIMRGIRRMPLFLQWLTNLNYIRFSLESTIINSYGFDRCSQTSDAVNQTSFVDQIPAEKLLEVYSSDKIDADLLMKSIDDVMIGITGSDRSVVMSLLNVSDDDYQTGIVTLFLHFLFYRVLTYFVIMNKIRSGS